MPSEKMPPGLVERQVHRWDRISAALRRHPGLERKEERIHRPIITISGSAGSGRETLAVALSKELNYEIYGRELVEKVALDLGLNKPIVAGMDERVESEIRIILSTWLRGREIESSDYIRSLVRVIVGIARSGGGIILGRGAAFVLEQIHEKVGVSLRLEAPENLRIDRIAASRKISIEEAKKYVKNNDSEQQEFVRRYLHREVDDPKAYDLVINTGRFETQQCVEMVLKVLCLRGHDLRKIAGAK